MHQSSYDHMKLCVEEYLSKDRHYRIADLGSRRVVRGHLTHRRLLRGYDVEYVGLDVEDGPNVDVVMEKPYRIPLKSNSVDVVMTNQVFEHIPFPWASFLEISRVLKPGGLVFLVAPSRGHRHGYQDCWRYYPDSLRALAAFARMQLVEMHVDLPPRIDGTKKVDYAAIDTERAYWGDAVGVYRKPAKPSKLVRIVGEVTVRWANRVGGLDPVPRPKQEPRRREARRRVTAPE